MRKKQIEKLPVKKLKTKSKERIKAQMYREILVIDCYENGVFTHRYALDKDKEYAMFCAKKKEWKNWKMPRAFGYTCVYDYYEIENNIKIDTEEDKERIAGYLNMGKESNVSQVIREIGWEETEIMREKRQCAYERKQMRINELMASIPGIPEGFEKWIDEKVIPEEYMFYDKEKDRYLCTACRKTHRFKLRKHNSIQICCRTGKETQIKKKGKGKIRISTRAVLFQRTGKDRQMVATHYKIYKECGAENGKPYKEIDWTGEVRVAADTGIKIYYNQSTSSHGWWPEDWWDTNPKNKRMGKCFAYPENIRNELEGTRYEHLGIETMAEKGWYLDYNRVMRSESGIFEYLAKGGYKKLTEDLADRVCLWDGEIYGEDIDTDGQDIEEIFDINMQRMNRIKQNNGGIVTLRWLQWEQWSRKKIKDHVVRWYEEKNISPEEIKCMTDYMSPEKTRNYLEKQAEQTGISEGKLIGFYSDYMEMAVRLGRDTSDQIVYRPKDIKIMHDLELEELNRMDAEEEEKRITEKFQNINGILKELKQYEYENDTYAFVIPDQAGDIISDGRTLHTCVATTDRYFERIIREESYIGFVRKKEYRNLPYYTIEFEPDGTVRQKRSEYNRQPDIEEITGFLKEWQKEIKKKMTEKTREKQKKARLAYRKDMQELEKTSPDFAEKLKADLMKAM